MVETQNLMCVIHSIIDRLDEGSWIRLAVLFSEKAEWSTGALINQV